MCLFANNQRFQRLFLKPNILRREGGGSNPFTNDLFFTLGLQQLQSLREPIQALNETSPHEFKHKHSILR